MGFEGVTRMLKWTLIRPMCATLEPPRPDEEGRTRKLAGHTPWLWLVAVAYYYMSTEITICIATYKPAKLHKPVWYVQ